MANLYSSRHIKFIRIIFHKMKLIRDLLYMLIHKEEKMVWNFTCLGKVLLASEFQGCIVILQSSIKNSLLIALMASWGKHEFSKE